jgi:hypothetical protein
MRLKKKKKKSHITHILLPHTLSVSTDSRTLLSPRRFYQICQFLCILSGRFFPASSGMLLFSTVIPSLSCILRLFFLKALHTTSYQVPGSWSFCSASQSHTSQAILVLLPPSRHSLEVNWLLIPSFL